MQERIRNFHDDNDDDEEKSQSKNSAAGLESTKSTHLPILEG